MPELEQHILTYGEFKTLTLVSLFILICFVGGLFWFIFEEMEGYDFEEVCVEERFTLYNVKNANGWEGVRVMFTDLSEEDCNLNEEWYNNMSSWEVECWERCTKYEKRLVKEVRDGN